MTLPDASIVALAAALYFAGGFVKGAIGFGLPLVTISVLPFFLPVEIALAMNGVVLLATNVVQFLRAGEHRRAVELSLPLLAGTALATPVGIWIATQLPAPVLLLTLGIFVVLFAGMGLLAISPRVPPGRGAAVVVGCAGGIVGAFSSAPGPIFVMYLVSRALPRALYMAVLGLVMAGVGAFLTVGHLITGALDGERLLAGTLLLLPATAGFVLGDKVAKKLPDSVFRRVVLGVLVVLGAVMIRRAIGGL